MPVKYVCEKTGEFLFATSGTIVAADIGKTVYLVDNQTVALAGDVTPDIAVGEIVEVVSAGVWVNISRQVDKV